MTRELTTLLEGGTFFEGPRWRDGYWWVSDFYRHGVFAVSPDGREQKVMDVPGQPSGLGWMPDGSMLVVSMRDRKLLRRTEAGEIVEHADLSGHVEHLLNDMVVDHRGGAWLGHFGFDLMNGADPDTATLLHVAPNGSASVAAEGLCFPNGMLITQDGRTLIVAESFGCRLTAFTINDDNSLGEARVWAQFAPTPELTTLEDMIPRLPVGPDGCSLDAEGRIWVADAFGSRCLRVAEGGAILDEIAMPEGMGAFACMLGGEDGRTLLICSAPDFHEHERAAAREAVLFTCTADTPHAGLP